MNSPEHSKFLAQEWLESWADSGLEWKHFPTSSLMAHLASSAMAPAAPPVDRTADAINEVSIETPPEASSAAVTLSVIFVVPSEPSAQGLALLARMVSAMGIDGANVGLITANDPHSVRSLFNWNDSRQALAKAWVGMGAAPDSSTLDLQTHSLDEVLANPALKKPVWEGLQKIMHKLGLR